eukprot:CAMPEP_0198649508 /NCGR_PEP_ID=MMETSP1467-20131203/4309_1 /TAXON_ID=1462469 /ORGANISM="unid. sp., Strain CCMP2135" /LENGTH=839 /DNA_ID=CAMNT_0044385303 /DNA_START=145 /DNA_END=2664 /DNA_ORIENTATION=+
MSLERRQARLRKNVLGELQFMLHHFNQMLKATERKQRSASTENLVVAGNKSRLSSFIPHLQQTIDQLHAPLASEEAFEKLEAHLTKTLLPVKRRLAAQLKRTALSDDGKESADEADDAVKDDLTTTPKQESSSSSSSSSEKEDLSSSSSPQKKNNQNDAAAAAETTTSSTTKEEEAPTTSSAASVVTQNGERPDYEGMSNAYFQTDEAVVSRKRAWGEDDDEALLAAMAAAVPDDDEDDFIGPDGFNLVVVASAEAPNHSESEEEAAVVTEASESSDASATHRGSQRGSSSKRAKLNNSPDFTTSECLGVMRSTCGSTSSSASSPANSPRDLPPTKPRVDDDDSPSSFGEQKPGLLSAAANSTSAPALIGESPRPCKPATPGLRRRASIQVLPKQVEYHCAKCGEVYTSKLSSNFNPWWSLVRQACPKCEQRQFPWIDISSETNQITHQSCSSASGKMDDDDESDDDDDTDAASAAGNDDPAPMDVDDQASSVEAEDVVVEDPTDDDVVVSSSKETSTLAKAEDAVLDALAADLEDGATDDDEAVGLALDDDDDDDGAGAPRNEQLRGGELPLSAAKTTTPTTDGGDAAPSSEAEANQPASSSTFAPPPFEGGEAPPAASSCTAAGEEDDDDDAAAAGSSASSSKRRRALDSAEKLTPGQATALLDLFEHARRCPGRHRCRRHADICLSAKFLMLHVRDCRGTLPSGEPCPFPWCRQLKGFLRHVLQCTHDECPVCVREATRHDPPPAEPQQPDAFRSAGLGDRTEPEEGGAGAESSPSPRNVDDAGNAAETAPSVVRGASDATVEQRRRGEALARPALDYWDTLDRQLSGRDARAIVG